ncbi:MAG: SLBB domain-containing protein [Armatimonadetes bacterium]|nr:SLBB domain-containing protein [Armatimonadota bacterium]MDE2206775.1 SLBB domain-containing protein [Armatimonadota bacterium]
MTITILFALVGAGVMAQQAGPGQPAPPGPGSGAKPPTGKSQVHPQPPVATPNNPLVTPLTPQPATLIPPTANYAGPFHDYRFEGTGVPEAVSSTSLPILGYDFFAPARELIRLRAKALQQKYSNANSVPTITGAPQQTPAVGAGGAPPAGTAATGDAQQPGTGPATGAGVTTGGTSGTTGAELQAPIQGPPGQIGQPFMDTSGSQAANGYQGILDPMTLMYGNYAATPPPNYRLQPGDTIVIRYWSPTMNAREETLTLDTRGDAAPAGTGPIALRGVTTQEADRILTQKLRGYYRDVEVTVTMGRLRTIAVTVNGQVQEPGTYLVPAGTTAFNLLAAAGGPRSTGTMRDIELRRNTRVVAHLDMYKFLLDGLAQGDVRLDPGDMLYIAPRRAQVSVNGDVRSPALVEMLSGETLKDALRYAGGIKPSGVAQEVQITTLVPGEKRVLRNVNVTAPASAGQVELFDGDQVNVFSVRNRLDNPVIVEGPVQQPGDYAMAPGMRVSDLVARAQGLLPEAYLQRAELFRWNPDNTTTLVPVNLAQAMTGDAAQDPVLARWDRLHIYTQDEIAWTSFHRVTIKGAVKNPGIYTRSDGMLLSDLVRMAGGLTPNASLGLAWVLHRHGDGTAKYSNVQLEAALNGDPTQDVVLQDRDTVAIYTADEARYMPEHVVTIRGEVVSQGSYPRGEGMKLSDLIRLAGGLKPSAGSTVVVAHARKVVDSPGSQPVDITVHSDSHGNFRPDDNVLLKDGDVVTVQGTGGFIDHVQIVTVEGAVAHPGPIVINTKKMRLSDAIRLAGGLRPEAYPTGAELTRDPKQLGTTGQRAIAEKIAQLNDLLNTSEYGREEARANVAQTQALESAVTGGTSAFGGAAPAAPVGLTTVTASKLVSPARELTDQQLQPTGNVAINLPDALLDPGGSHDILLADGDSITVPEQPTTVQVIGAVFNARGVVFKRGANLHYYIDQAGGFAPDAATKRIEVIHMGGGLIPARRVRSLSAGDFILVPTKVLAARISNNQNLFDSFFRSLTSAALVYKVATSVFGL